MASRRAVGLCTHLHDHDQQPRSGWKAGKAISFLHYPHAAQPDEGIFPHDFGGRAGRRRHLRRRGRDRRSLRRVDRQQGRGRAAVDRHNLPAGYGLVVLGRRPERALAPRALLQPWHDRHRRGQDLRDSVGAGPLRPAGRTRLVQDRRVARLCRRRSH